MHWAKHVSLINKVIKPYQENCYDLAITTCYTKEPQSLQLKKKTYVSINSNFPWLITFKKPKRIVIMLIYLYFNSCIWNCDEIGLENRQRQGRMLLTQTTWRMFQVNTSCAFTFSKAAIQKIFACHFQCEI